MFEISAGKNTSAKVHTIIIGNRGLLWVRMCKNEVQKEIRYKEYICFSEERNSWYFWD